MKSPWTSAPPSKGRGAGDTHLAVRAQPRASRSEIAGVYGDRLKVRLAAPPVEGAANKELEKLLAKELGIPRASVEVIRGAASRNKTVLISGLEPGEVRTRLKLL